jgi:2-polyprenyl-3-methyl-5-hydroxy-6-metoxy-1,4-benzoquinol methylase
LVYQDLLPDDEGLTRLYDTFIDPKASLDKRLFADHSYYSTMLRSVQLVRKLYIDRIPREAKLLDFGMGWGHWASMAQSFGFSCYGAELSEHRIAYAKSIGIQVCEDVLSPTFSKRFDFIHTEQVFEHLANPADVAKQLAVLLKPNGVLKISVPNGTGYKERVANASWRAAKDALHPMEHINAFSIKSVTALASQAGLRRLRLADFPKPADLTVIRAYLRSRVRPSWYFIKA